MCSRNDDPSAYSNDEALFAGECNRCGHSGPNSDFHVRYGKSVCDTCAIAIDAYQAKLQNVLAMHDPDCRYCTVETIQ